MAYVNTVLLRAMFAARDLPRRLRDEVGQDTIEWAMLSGLVAIGIVGVLGVLSGYITNLIDGIGACIDFNGGTPCLPGGIF